MHAFLAAFCFLAGQTETLEEFRVTIRTEDGSSFMGTARLPAKLALSTKFGDVTPETRTLSQIKQVGGVWILIGINGQFSGKLALDSVTVVTAGGALKIPLADIGHITLQPPAAARPPEIRDPAAPKPRFSGPEVRKGYADDPQHLRHADLAILVAGGRYLALLDRPSAECVLLELSSGKVTRVRVDAGPSHLIERNSKLYVANTEARSITVIDLQSLQVLRQIPVDGPPRWFSAPGFGSLVYLAVDRSEFRLQCLDTKTDSFLDPLGYSQGDGNVLLGLHFIQASPDNRYLLTMGRSFAYPVLFEIRDHGVGLLKRMEEKHWPSAAADFRAGRTYLGSQVYSADLQQRVGSIPNADLLVPHPSKRLLFGRKCPPSQPSEIVLNRGTTILLIDEETLGTLGEIEVGDRVLALAPAEDLLHVLSETRVYSIELKAQVPAEALARVKPVRNEGDLARLEASTGTRRASHSLPRLGGWTLLDDQRTLVAALTEKAELIHIDTVDGAELRRDRLEFQPGSMASQGRTLYVIRANSSFLYAVDAATGKVKQEFKIPGDPLVRLACAPKGRLYASTAKGGILSIDPASGAAAATGARGLFLAVDPKGQFVYTGRTSPNDWEFEIEKDADGVVTFYSDNWGYRSMIRKYAVSGTSLKQAAITNNAAVNGRALVLSPDGTRIAMPGGGGWRPKQSGGGAGGYTIAVFDTKDLSTMLGQVDLGAYPENIAFHPILDKGAALKSESELTLFNTKSLTSLKKWQILGAPRGFNEPGWLLFAGRGETLVYWQMASITEKNQTGRLYLIPLDLSPEEKSALQKVYGRTAAVADPARLFREAEEAERRGDKASAARLYRQVTQEDPGSDLARRAGTRLLAMDEGAGASASGLLKTAKTLLDGGDSDRALRYFRRIVEEHPAAAEAQEARKKIQDLERK